MLMRQGAVHQQGLVHPHHRGLFVSSPQQIHLIGLMAG